jgi:hypothetical protein
MNICVFVYLLRNVSTNYYGHYQSVSQLHEVNYIEVEASAMQTMSIKYLYVRYRSKYWNNTSTKIIKLIESE